MGWIVKGMNMKKLVVAMGVLGISVGAVIFQGSNAAAEDVGTGVDYSYYYTGTASSATSCSNDPRAKDQLQHTKVKTCSATRFLNLTAQVRIAILDTGISSASQDLIPRVISSFNLTADRSADDFNGHGTNVASLAAGARNNSTSGFGTSLSSGTRIINVKVLDQWGNGTLAGVTNGIGVALNAGADVINLSIWCRREGGCVNTALTNALTGAVDSGAVVVKIAGNANMLVPAGTENAAIGAKAGGLLVASQSAADGTKASSSNYSTSYVDLAAPGTGGVCGEVIAVSFFNYQPWACLSGTSMAAPLVAGAAANVIAYHRQYGQTVSPAKVEDYLTRTSPGSYTSAYYSLMGSVKGARELNLENIAASMPPLAGITCGSMGCVPN